MENEKHRSEEHEFEKKVNFWGWLVTLIVAGIPYLVLIVGIEVAKTTFTGASWKSAYGIAGAVIATAIAGLIFAKTKQWCFKKVRRHLQDHKNANNKE